MKEMDGKENRMRKSVERTLVCERNETKLVWMLYIITISISSITFSFCASSVKVKIQQQQ